MSLNYRPTCITLPDISRAILIVTAGGRGISFHWLPINITLVESATIDKFVFR